MTTATIRLPVRSALVQAPPYPTHGIEVLASIRLDILADALRSMEHDDIDPGERPMNADQCRDALLRELLGGWSPSELVEAKIPGVLQMADEIATLRRERDEARARLPALDAIASECADWIVQPYAGANSECYFCGHPPGVHDSDCISVRAKRALRTTPTPGAQP